MLLSGVALWLCTVSLSTPPLRAQTPISGQPIAELTTLDTTMTQIMSQWNVPGAALAVTYNGRLVFAHGYGYANSATLEPVHSPTHCFESQAYQNPSPQRLS